MSGAFPPDETQLAATGAQPSVGHPMLDDDHAKLWAMTLAFRREVREGNPLQAMALFENLLTGAQAHFLREELLLSHQGLSALEIHRQDHQTTLRKLMVISGDDFLFLRSWPGLAGDLAYSLIQRSLAHDLTEAEIFSQLMPLRPIPLGAELLS